MGIFLWSTDKWLLCQVCYYFSFTFLSWFCSFSLNAHTSLTHYFISTWGSREGSFPADGLVHFEGFPPSLDTSVVIANIQNEMNVALQILLAGRRKLKAAGKSPSKLRLDHRNLKEKEDKKPPKNPIGLYLVWGAKKKSRGGQTLQTEQFSRFSPPKREGVSGPLSFRGQVFLLVIQSNRMWCNNRLPFTITPNQASVAQALSNEQTLSANHTRLINYINPFLVVLVFCKDHNTHSDYNHTLLYHSQRCHRLASWWCTWLCR